METNEHQEDPTAVDPDTEPAPEWKGQDLAALREKEADLDVVYEEMSVFRASMKAQQEEIKARIDAADKAVCIEIGKLIDEDSSALVRGGWECPDSPAGHCEWRTLTMTSASSVVTRVNVNSPSGHSGTRGGSVGLFTFTTLVGDRRP